MSDDRMQVSRRRLRQILDMAFGVYLEQEPKKEDSWRDEEYGTMFGHLKHEMEEISRSDSRTKQLHNCLDACVLSALLAAKILEKEE